MILFLLTIILILSAFGLGACFSAAIEHLFIWFRLLRCLLIFVVAIVALVYTVTVLMPAVTIMMLAYMVTILVLAFVVAILTLACLSPVATMMLHSDRLGAC
jgi:hypothetical protein